MGAIVMEMPLEVLERFCEEFEITIESGRVTEVKHKEVKDE